MSGRLVSRRGFLLPIALLLVLAVSATSLSILILARTEVLSEGGDHRYLRERIGEEERLASMSSWDLLSGEQVEGVSVIPLAGGFLLLLASGREDAPASASIYWRLNPDSAAYTLLPGALEIGGGGIPGGGVRSMTREEGCTLLSGGPLVRVRQSDSLPPPSPPLSLPPRLGPIGFAELLELAATPLPMEGELPPLPDDTSPVMRVPSGARINGGWGGGLLLAEGDLYLGGETRFRGIVLVRGDLRMDEYATIEGVALVGGSAYLDGESRILGCPGLAASALDHPELIRLRSVRGGEILGRF